MNDTKPDYDVALSYASEDRAYVDKVASRLKAKRIKVFYDQFETTKLWGKNLYDHFAEIYGKAKYAVVFISKSYSEKAWTNHELKSAQARAFQEKREYILPVRFDDTEIPGIPRTIAYVDARSTTPAELSKKIIEKLHDLYPTELSSSTEKSAVASTVSESHVRNAEAGRGFGRRRYLIFALVGVLLLFGATFGFYRNLQRPCGPEIGNFREQLRDAIDLVSLLAPDDLDRETISALNKLQKETERNLTWSCAWGHEWDELTKLTKALTTIVNDRKIKDAVRQIDDDGLSKSPDRFIRARALLLKAADPISEGVCFDPKDTLLLLNQAIETDPRIVAAFNLRGVCLAEQSMRLLVSGEPNMSPADTWTNGVERIRGSLFDNLAAFQTKSSPKGAQIRFLNNRTWNSTQFLLGAMLLGDEKLKEGLRVIGDLQRSGNFESMKSFFDGALSDIKRCQELSPEQAKFYESEADLYAFEVSYYSHPRYKDIDQAQSAKSKMYEALEKAFSKGLLKGRENWEAVQGYFMIDVFLAPYAADPDLKYDAKVDDPDKQQILLVIKRVNDNAKVDPQIQLEIKNRVEKYLKLQQQQSTN